MPISSALPSRSSSATKASQTESWSSRFDGREAGPASHPAILSPISASFPLKPIHPGLDPHVGLRSRTASHFSEMADQKCLFLAFPGHSVRLKFDSEIGDLYTAAPADPAYNLIHSRFDLRETTVGCTPSR